MNLFLIVFLSACVLCCSGIPCNLEFGVRIDDGKILPNGYIAKDGVLYAPKNYKEIDGVKIGCICNIKVCVRKCCPEGEFMANKTCQPSQMPFVISESVGPSAGSFHFLNGNKCKPKQRRTLLDPASVDAQIFLLQDDGRLLISASKTYYKQQDYCVDYIDEPNETKALVCDYTNPEITATNQIGMIISMPFLLATFIIYAILPDRNLHGKSLMCYVISLFGAYLLLVTMQLNPTYFEVSLCKTLALLCLFFFMVSFFWMNVISIDIWWTFSGLRGFSGTKRQKAQKRFLLYCGYAWGVPMLLVIIVTCLTFSEEIPVDAWYNPGIADGQCWFREKVPTMLYFYGPLTVLIIVNIILFCITAWKIKQLQKGTDILRKNGQKHNYEKDQQRFNLYLKLMLAMGINWSMEIISWILNWQVEQIPRPIWYLTDFCNAVYGIFIFFIFVFKKTIWNSLKKRYYIMIGKPHLARAITLPQQSQSSATSRSIKIQKMPIVHFVNTRELTNGNA